MQWCDSTDTHVLLKQEYSMAWYYIMRRSSVTQQVAQVRNLLSDFGVTMASPLSALLDGMIRFVEPDSGLFINNLSILVEWSSFKLLGFALRQRFN
jgi:hypothetical protein